MTYLLRNIAKACELLSVSPFRRALDLLAVGAEGWTLHALPHQSAKPAEPGTVCPEVSRDSQVLQTSHMCAHMSLACHLGEMVQPSGMIREPVFKRLILLGSSSFFPDTMSLREKGPSLSPDGWEASHDEERGPLKEMVTVGRLQYQKSSFGVPRASQEKKLPGPQDRLATMSWGLQATLAHIRVPVLLHAPEELKAGLLWAGNF